MKAFVFLAAVMVASVGQAASVPSAVTKAVAKLKAEQVRTIITKTKMEHSNPCDGGYIAQIQVKQAYRTGPDGFDISYKWETVKEVSVDATGSVMEICME